MNDNERSVVQEYFESLVNGLRVVDLVDSLISSRAITTEEYQQADHRPTDKGKMRELLIILLDKTHPKDIDIFQCLLRSIRAIRADLASDIETEYNVLVEQADEVYMSCEEPYTEPCPEEEEKEEGDGETDVKEQGNAGEEHEGEDDEEDEEMKDELDALGAGLDITDLPINCRLAPSFEEKDESLFRPLDERLKLAMVHTMRLINESGDYSWENLMRCMTNNSLIKSIGGSSAKLTDKLSKSEVNNFKVFGAASEEGIKEINTWIEGLIKDDDISLKVIQNKAVIDLVTLSAETGALVNSVGSFFYREIHEKRDAEDMGILRYPNQDCPHFKIYNVRLKAARDCARTLYTQQDRLVIDGEVHKMRFKLRDHISKSSSS